MRSRVKTSALYLLPILLLLIWSLFIYRFSPADIVEYVGAENGYVATVLLSFMGGVSVVVGIPYHLAIMVFAAGGLNPWLLGIAASIGQFAGDNTTYMLGFTGRHALPERISATVDRFLNELIDRPYWQMALALFVYGAVAPFSNDWILSPMGLVRHPYIRIMVPLELGNLVFNTGAALIGTYGISSVLGS